MPRHTLEPARDAQELLHLRIGLLHLPQRLALVERLVQRHVERGRDLLGHPVDVGVRHLEDTPHVPYDGFRLHRPERDDLRHVLASVLLRHVVDHFAAAPLAEIDVDVGHRHAFRVEEPLEDEVELQRIHVGDAQAVRDQASRGGSTARTDRNAALTRVPDEVPDDQEVPGVLHPLDHLDLVREAGFVFVDRAPQRARRGELTQPGQPRVEAFPHHVLEVLVDRVRRRHVEVRQVALPLRELHVAAFGDPYGIAQRLWRVGEGGSHLVSGLEEELPAVVPEPLRIGQRFSSTDAEQHIVRVRVGLAKIVHVVGADERQAKIAGNRRQPRVHNALILDPVPLQFEEEVLPSQDVAIGGRGLDRLTLVAARQALRHLSFETAAQSDETLRMLREEVLVESRLVVEALGVAGRDELDQVVVPLAGLRQQHQVIRRLAGIAALGVAAARRHVDLAAQNRPDAALPRVIVKDYRREHVAVLGDRDRRHLQLRRLIEKLVDAARAVEQGVFGVKVEVDEFRHYQP